MKRTAIFYLSCLLALAAVCFIPPTEDHPDFYRDKDVGEWSSGRNCRPAWRQGTTAVKPWGSMSRAFAQGPALPAGDLGQALQDFSKLSASQKNMILEGTGIPRARDFNPARIMAYFIFGAVGFVAFVYGKKNAFWRPMVIGLTLMIYPYFVSGTVSLYLVGVLLIAALYFWRE